MTAPTFWCMYVYEVMCSIININNNNPIIMMMKMILMSGSSSCTSCWRRSPAACVVVWGVAMHAAPLLPTMLRKWCSLRATVVYRVRMFCGHLQRLGRGCGRGRVRIQHGSVDAVKQLHQPRVLQRHGLAIYFILANLKKFLHLLQLTRSGKGTHPQQLQQTTKTNIKHEEKEGRTCTWWSITHTQESEHITTTTVARVPSSSS